jgi:predicted metal-dependent phosphoesterase TrpH
MTVVDQGVMNCTATRADESSRLRKADLHVHSCHDGWGDGNQTVAELFRYVQEETDLSLFAITDHDSVAAAYEGRELHTCGQYRFDFLPGVEVTTLSGHLLCYFPGEIVDVPSLRPLWWTVRYVHKHNGICVAAHPIYPPWFWRTLLRDLGKDEHHLDGVEVINGSVKSVRAQTQLQAVGELLTRKTALVGNSDAHDQRAIGSAYTTFPGCTVEEYLAALRSGTVQAHRGHQATIPTHARWFTRRRAMTRPGWVRNLYRQVISRR